MFLKNGCVASERSEVGALPESLQMPFGGVPFDADDLLVGLVDAAGRFPALAVRRGVEQCAARRYASSNSALRSGVDSVADVLDYSQIIARAVRALDHPRVFADLHEPLRHLIVDEYQDVNPAQEALVDKLAAEPVHLCVVGDDDQSIYQWRGSDVQNIIEFENRYAPVKQFKIQKNRRSRPTIIDYANRLANNIEGRLEKRMEEHRPPHDDAEVVVWMQSSPEDEARVIAEAIRHAHEARGYQFKEMAVLCRGRVSLPPLIDAFREHDIPLQSSGRTIRPLPRTTTYTSSCVSCVWPYGKR
jgi:superfamily I DNA/RNA helicase